MGCNCNCHNYDITNDPISGYIKMALALMEFKARQSLESGSGKQ